VFGDVDADSAEQVVANWEKIKQQEKGRSSVTEGIPMNLPSLLLSTKLQRKAISVGLSDLDLDGDGSSIAETAAALEHAQSDRETPGPDAELSTNDAANVRLVGELLFAAANLARRLGIDPEQALRARALTFRDRVVAFEGA
jgi:XTP/dITP diphosphohydrolase